MKVVLKVDDEVYDHYVLESEAKTAPNKRRLYPEDLMAHRLLAAIPLDPDKRTLVLQPQHLNALEAKLGNGHLMTAEQLVQRVDRLAKINFHSHEIVLSPAQYEELAFRAMKQGKTIAEMIQLTWKKMQEDFFTRVP